MKRILIAPLDWGFGHATRCIPVIRKLIDRDCNVVLAGSGPSLVLLHKEFPHLTCFELPGYAPQYPRAGSMVWKMIRQLPHFMRVIREEHKVLNKISIREKIDLVISDNRYGCWTTKVPCVFITHQSNILMPKRFGWLAPLVRKINQRMMKRFTWCWIPDYPGRKSLAGELISFGRFKHQEHIRFIGLLSRFIPSGIVEKKHDLLCIFSGPEPQRTIFENIVLKQLENFDGRAFVIRGVVDGDPVHTHVPVVDLMTSDDLQKVIESSQVVLARSGFSTIMDLTRLSSRAILIATPGQTEQEYLARKLSEQKIVYSVPQHEFDLNEALQQVNACTGFSWNETDETYLDKAIDEVLNR